jgi:RNA polymerase sigma-70 factor (ECF subfamily)
MGDVAAGENGADPTGAATQELLERIYRDEYPRILAQIARLTGDLGLAEDALQDAIGAAIASWSRSGAPANPGAWLTTVARRRAIDTLRREGRRSDLETRNRPVEPEPPEATGPVVDDQLRLMFVTCHPSLTPETRTALTLRYVCGLRTHEIARVLLVGDDAVTKRIRRARRKIRDARIPMRVPAPERLGERLRSVLECLYLVFTEGYSATDGERLVRVDLCAEAIRLTRLVVDLDPSNRAALSLLALELLQDSRSSTRSDGAGRPVLLADQDRARWDRDQIDEALGLLGRARATGDSSTSAQSYLLQATIAAEHAVAPTWERTDWPRICSAYDELYELTGSPVVGLNRVVATSMAVGPQRALVQMDALASDDRVVRTHQWHLVRADLLERLGEPDGAAREYRAALDTAMNDPERAFVAQRLDQVGGGA